MRGGSKRHLPRHLSSFFTLLLKIYLIFNILNINTFSQHRQPHLATLILPPLRSGVNLSPGGDVNLERTKKELGRTCVRSGVNPSLGGDVNPERTKKELGRTCIGRLERT